MRREGRPNLHLASPPLVILELYQSSINFQRRTKPQFAAGLQISVLKCVDEESFGSQLLDSRSLVLSDLHAAEDQFLHVVGQFSLQLVPLQGHHYTCAQILFGLAVTERGVAVVKFINHDSEGPNISFGTVHVVQDAFGRHVEGRTNIQISEIGGAVEGESEICDFGDAIVEEDVGYFEISMDDIFGG